MDGGGLLQVTSGIFYGTTSQGGIYKGNCTDEVDGCGTIFTLRHRRKFLWDD
jgi:hypothetical protein